MYHVAKPTPEQLVWQDMELGVFIHFCVDIYNPDFKGVKNAGVRDAIPPERITPKDLDVDQWLRSAKEMGAKYAILVANHCTGFSLWPTAENDYSVKSLKWKDGKGDVCRDFIEACRKYDIKPGFYYSTGCNGYYDINDHEIVGQYQTEKYREYVKHVEAQVKELWTKYGELFEIWFDGGIVPVSAGGPDIKPLLEKYQPNAICFQGPRDHPNRIRWVGNENGVARENCWATTNAGDIGFDGTVPQEQAGVGDPDGIHYWPAETDMPNRRHRAFGSGWYWREGQEEFVLTPEELFESYLTSVGRNTNLLLGMGISTDGDFKDEEQFRAFGKLIRDAFATPLAAEIAPANECTLEVPSGKNPKYLVVREDIRDGQRIREFVVEADGREVYRSSCVGHKRIIPLEPLGADKAGTITFRVTESAGEAKLRDVVIC